MAVTQPYFDPNVYAQKGNFFTNYLNSLVKVRSEQNRMLMDYALRQQDPKFLKQQMDIIDANIERLRKAEMSYTGDALDLYADEAASKIRLKDTQLLKQSKEERAKQKAEEKKKKEEIKSQKTAGDIENKTNTIFNQVMSDETFEQIVKEVGAAEAPGSPFFKGDISEPSTFRTAMNSATVMDQETAVQKAAKEVLTKKLRATGMKDSEIDNVVNLWMENSGIFGGITDKKAEIKKSIQDKFTGTAVPTEAPAQAPTEAPTEAPAQATAQAPAEDMEAYVSQTYALPQAKVAEYKKQIADQIKAYEDQKKEIMKDYMSASQSMDMYGMFAPRGITNLALNTPFIRQAQPPKRIGGRSIDEDIVQMVNEKPVVKKEEIKEKDLDLVDEELVAEISAPSVQLPQTDMSSLFPEFADEDEDGVMTSTTAMRSGIPSFTPDLILDIGRTAGLSKKGMDLLAEPATDEADYAETIRLLQATAKKKIPELERDPNVDKKQTELLKQFVSSPQIYVQFDDKDTAVATQGQIIQLENKQNVR